MSPSCQLCRMCGKMREATASLLDQQLRWAISYLDIKLNDGLPTSVCSDCEQELRRWSSFLDNTAAANERLQKRVTSEVLSNEALKKLLSKFNISECKVNVEKLTNDKIVKICSDLKSNISSVHIKNTAKYQCNICKSNLKSRDILIAHLKTHNYKFKCKKCTKSFKSESSLKTHLLNHIRFYDKPNFCRFCSYVCNSEENLTHHSVVHAENKNKCAECDKILSAKCALKEHMSTHTNLRPYRCSFCPASFKVKPLLDRHTCSKHLNLEYSFQCDICTKKFRCKQEILRHIYRHLDIRPFICNICSHTSKTNGDLTVHKKQVHTKACNYKCIICNKAFKTRSTLNQHIKIHNAGLDFKCKICNKAFKTCGSLHNHVNRVHSNKRPFKCDICDKTFKTNSDCQDHVSIHSDEKPFKCSLCSKCFKSSRYLRQHNARVHATVAKFKCAQCNLAFKIRDRLIQHLKIHDK